MESFNAYKAAQASNMRVATLRDNQLYKSCHGFELRECAAAAAKHPIIGTAKEIGEKYGHLLKHQRINFDRVADHEDKDIFLWAFGCTLIGRKRDITLGCIMPLQRL